MESYRAHARKRTDAKCLVVLIWLLRACIVDTLIQALQPVRALLLTPEP